MEETALDGPAVADNPSGDGVAPSIGSDGGVPVPAASGGDTWSSALNEDNQRLVENKGWQSPDEALRSYRELDEYRGRSVALPDDQASDEDWQQFRRKTGMPDTADGYQLTPLEGTDTTALAGLQDLFHTAGLDRRQADAIYTGMVSAVQQTEASVAARQAEQQAQVQAEAEADLSRDWGAVDGVSFKRNLELARRAIEALGGDDLLGDLRRMGAVTDTNQILSPAVAKAFAEVGSQLFAEDRLIEEGETLSVNPFADDSLNLAAQGDLVKRDPLRARRFIQAAGKRPEH